MPGVSPHDIPHIMDTGQVYSGSATQFECTLDITQTMTWGLMRLNEIVPADRMDAGTQALAEFISDRERNIMSGCDGGQLMFNVVFRDNAILFNSHLGAYEGILKSIEPKPNVAVLGIAGRANYNGRPFDGSAAQFALKQAEWLERPQRIIWCMHDERYCGPLGGVFP